MDGRRRSSYVALHSTLHSLGFAPPCCSVFPPRSCTPPLRICVRGGVGGSHHGGAAYRTPCPLFGRVGGITHRPPPSLWWSTGKARVTFNVRGGVREVETSNPTPHCIATACHVCSRSYASAKARKSGVPWFVCCIVCWCPLVLLCRRFPVTTLDRPRGCEPLEPRP